MKALAAFVLLALRLRVAAHYMPGTNPQEFAVGDFIKVEVGSLVTSQMDMPISHYSMPFCKPPEGVRRSKDIMHPGTTVLGTGIENSPYKFTIATRQKGLTVCNGDEYPDHAYPALNPEQVKMLQDGIRQNHLVRLFLDGLPITTYDLELDPPRPVRPGYEVGYQRDGKYYVNNHLMFKVLVHESDRQDTMSAQETLWNQSELPEAKGKQYSIVGFEVLPCSIKRTPGEAINTGLMCPMVPDDPNAPEPQEVKKGEHIVYTYDVYWDKSDITWSSRSDFFLPQSTA